MSTENSQTFDRIEQSYLTSWCRFNPETALDAGIEDYAGELTPCDDVSLGIQVVLNEKCLAALDEIDPTQLDPDRLINYRILHGWAVLEHHEFMDHDWRYRDPARFLPIDAIHQLTIRPLESFNQPFLSRLGQIPNRVREAKTFLNERPELIPPVWLEMAIQECEAGLQFCHELPNHPRVQKALTRKEHIDSALHAAGKALEAFHHTLKRLDKRANGSFACGRQHFERLLQHRHFLPISAHKLKQFGEELFEKTQQELKQVEAETGLTLAKIKDNHPSAGQLLSFYQQEMQASYDYLTAHDLVSMPGRQHLSVVDTPSFLRHQIPFAAYVAPSVADLRQSAFYYVTPVTTDAELREHSFAAIAQTSVHEAWPGHHLQFVSANQSDTGSALVRRLFPCSTLYEGWALYCEEMMLEHGFERYPGQRLIMLNDRLWRALRVIIDVNIHSGEWTLEQAVQEMVDKLGFSHQQAVSECNWYSQAPTIPMSYAAGWALISTLKDIVNPTDDKALKAFHDKLLSCGSVALPLVIEHQFGSTIWQRCCQHVFGES